MRVVVLTGLSGSGKSTAIHALEDIGYYTIDNLPVPLIQELVELFSTQLGEVQKLALVVDARATQFLKKSGADNTDLAALPRTLEQMRERGHQVDLVFLDAVDEALERRYSETRRRHPLESAGGGVKSGIAAERALLEPLENAATFTLDTTGLSVHELRRQIQHAFSSSGVKSALAVTVLSFGFKHGLPPEADLVFDVRFLPNPHFVPDLRHDTGESEPVARYVLEREDTHAFLGKLEELLSFLLPRYEEEGKAYLTIAVGCTGGRHRSVAIVRELATWLEREGRRVQIRHRDISRS